MSQRFPALAPDSGAYGFTPMFGDIHASLR
jgi:hypothetical protein